MRTFIINFWITWHVTPLSTYCPSITMLIVNKVNKMLLYDVAKATDVIYNKYVYNFSIQEIMMLKMKTCWDMAPPRPLSWCQPWKWWNVKNRNFHNSDPFYHRFVIFTSNQMFSRQAKTKKLISNRLLIIKALRIQDDHHFAKNNISDTISNNIR